MHTFWLSIISIYALIIGPTQVVRMDNLTFQDKVLWRMYAQALDVQ
jgi:hypothetical protein